MKSVKERAIEIITFVGGKKNIKSLYHCATRLRFTLVDKKKFDIDNIKSIPGVLGAVVSNEECQIIIGAEVSSFYKELMDMLDLGEMTENDKSTVKEKPLRRVLDTIVGIMSPVATVLIAGGIFKVFLAFCVLFGMSKEGINYQILNFISDSPFYFLPFMLANSAAQKFRTNPYLAMMMAGVLLHPNFSAMVTAADPIALFGAPIRLSNYGYSVIPIILVVWFMSYIEKFADRFVPNIVKTIIKPLLIVLITAPIALIIIGPIGAFFGDGLFNIINFLNQNVPWIVPTIIGTFFPLLLTVGMHAALVPLATLSFAEYGSENIQGTGVLASTFALASASLAIFIREKGKEKEIALSSAITAFSGITEPALFTVALKYKRVLPCVMISGGVAGLYAGITGVVRYSFGSPGLFTLPIFIGEPGNFRNAIITVVISSVLAFVSTYFLAIVDVKPEKEKLTKQKLKSVVDGEVIPLNKVNDEVFSSGAMGSGIAIYPENGMVVAPIKSKISMAYETGHAIGLTTDNNTEILIHIGLDTVKQNGKGFKILVQQDQIVQAGDPLVEFDLNLLKEEGFDPTVMVIVLNTSSDKIAVNEQENVTIDDDILSIL